MNLYSSFLSCPPPLFPPVVAFGKVQSGVRVFRLECCLSVIDLFSRSHTLTWMLAYWRSLPT